MNPVLAYLLFLLALLSAGLLLLQSWAAAIPLILFAWLFGEWASITLARAARRRKRRRDILTTILERTQK